MMDVDISFNYENNKAKLYKTDKTFKQVNTEKKG